jgi:hypothetical protein
LLGCLWPGTAAAFTCETPFSDGCHEAVTAAAIRTTGWPDGQADPTDNGADATLVENLLFHPPTDLADRWSVAALVGVRHNDFAGNRPTSPDRLAAIHNHAEEQGAHCLRAPGDDGVEGDAAALSACRAYILAEVEEALGASDVIDLEDTVSVSLALKYEVTDVAMSRFAFHMGHALHALQDSFTHTFRHPDAPKVVLSVFNYIDPAFEPHYDPDIDGLPHRSDFDTCKPGQNVFRITQATAASVELLMAASGSTTRADRLAAVTQVLEAWLTPSTEPCDASNGYCGVVDQDGEPIEALRVPGLFEGDAGCAAPGATGAGAWCLLGLLALAFVLRRRIHRGRGATP